MRITLAFFLFLISLFLLHRDEVQSQISLRDTSSDQNRAKQSFSGQWTREEEKLRERTVLVEVVFLSKAGRGKVSSTSCMEALSEILQRHPGLPAKSIGA